MQIATQSSVELPGIQKLRSGKVREVFDLGETLLFVVTDRISAFDVILPDPIPYKGAVLTKFPRSGSSVLMGLRITLSRQILSNSRTNCSSCGSSLSGVR